MTQNPYAILPVILVAVIAVAVIGWGAESAFTAINAARLGLL